MIAKLASTAAILVFSLTVGVVRAPSQDRPGLSHAQEQPKQTPAPQRVRVSEKVSQSFIEKKVQPQYPPEARDRRIQGTVVLKAEISKEGDVTDLTLVSGDPLLAPAAIEAVKQWKYRPYLLNKQPIAVETQVSVRFEM